MEPDANSMQKFIEYELNKDNRTKLDFRIFNRETESFFENTPKMLLSAAENVFFLNNGEKIPVDKIVIQRYIGAQDRNGKKIYEGDYLLTNEGNWCGFVVFFDGAFMLVDPEGDTVRSRNGMSVRSSRTSAKWTAIRGNMFGTREKETEEWVRRDFLSTARFMSRRY